jgi:uncharacterized membrane protein YcaP (DUF421 family)
VLLPGVSSGVFFKLSKHLALLVCFLIVARASGRYAISPAGIFSFAAASVLAQLTGRARQLRFLRKILHSGFR